MRGGILAVAALVLAVPSGGSAQATRKAGDTSRNYYSETQAKRGKEQYAQFCAQCHGANLRGIGTAPALAGEAIMQDFYSVNDLFIKVSVTMPGDNVHGLPTDTYLNVIAYLFQANGLPAGTENLKGDVTAMKRMALMEKKPAKPAPGAADGFYTEEQAERGKGYFRGACSMCHAADPAQPDKRDLIAPPGRGFVAGPVYIQINLASRESFGRWRNVGSLFNKIRTSMPLNDGGALSTEEYVNIAAYLLHQGGVPAGKDELKPDPETLMGLTIPEKGFTTLFNGKDLTG